MIIEESGVKILVKMAAIMGNEATVMAAGEDDAFTLRKPIGHICNVQPPMRWDGSM